MITSSFDQSLITKYNIPCPRYTSYPTALQFSDNVFSTDYIEQANNSNLASKPLSLYFHIPFCNTLCYYCACNKIITKNKDRAALYVELLQKEIIMQSKLFDQNRSVTQLHWGGGTPTFLNEEQITSIMDTTRQHFNLYPDDSTTHEYSIEIDPRSVNTNTIKYLRANGFNRISMGVQDFNPIVQKAVHRIQDREETIAIIEAARRENFKSIHLDLIYGLPYQNTTSFADTIKQIIDISPDRISLFNYAHLPHRVPSQKRIDENTLPAPAEKLQILHNSIEQLINSGYVYIGMDHFAKATDELTIAQQKGSLYRNFQGYSTHADCDLIGLGISSISSFNNSYFQNTYTEAEYTKRIENQEFATIKGLILDHDDLLRKTIINNLACNFKLDIMAIEQQFKINFKDYFADELESFNNIINDELAILNNQFITVTDKGRFLIRNICATFDKYLAAVKTGHSKAI